MEMNIFAASHCLHICFFRFFLAFVILGTDPKILYFWNVQLFPSLLIISFFVERIKTLTFFSFYNILSAPRGYTKQLQLHVRYENRKASLNKSHRA